MVKILVKTEESVFQLCLFFGHSGTLLDGEITGDTKRDTNVTVTNYSQITITSPVCLQIRLVQQLSTE